MLPPLLSILVWLCSFAQAAMMDVKRVPRPLTSLSDTTLSPRHFRTALKRDSVAVANNYDLWYSTTMSIGGQSLAIQLDTGSSDLWAKPPQPLSSATPLSANVSLNYGIGNLFGAAVSSSVTLGGTTITGQDLVSYVSGNINNVFQAGLVGMLGLGFDGGSRVARQIQSFHNADQGLTLLSNYYAQNPTQPRIMAFSMSRQLDPDSPDGTFSIGEVKPEDSAVMTQPTLPLFVNTDTSDFQRWSTFLDAVEVNGQNMTLSPSVVKGAPSGKLISSFDTGTSLAWVPQSVVQAIYGDMKGYSATAQQFSVDCFATAQVAFWFGGQRIAIHPLDLTRVTTTTDANGNATTVCQNAFIFTSSLAAESHDLDAQLGDSFMRSAVTLFDFGTSGPSSANMKLLGLVTDETAAVADFVQVRSKQLGVAPPTTGANPGSTSSAAPTTAPPAVTNPPAPSPVSGPTDAPDAPQQITPTTDSPASSATLAGGASGPTPAGTKNGAPSRFATNTSLITCIILAICAASRTF